MPGATSPTPLKLTLRNASGEKELSRSGTSPAFEKWASIAAIWSPGSLDWATEKGTSAKTDRTERDIMVSGLCGG